MIKVQDLESSGIEDAKELVVLAAESMAYLEHFDWCEAVEEVWFAEGFSKVAVFHAKTRPEGEYFVIVGDIPPFHVDAKTFPTANEALEDYVAWMKDLCIAFKRGEDLDKFPPLLRRGSWLPLVANDALIEALSGRIGFIEKNLITA